MHELYFNSKKDLEEKLTHLKEELFKLRVQKLQKSSVKSINVVRKNIARVLTVINLKKRQEAKKLFAGKKYIPNDLRPKKTRALRRKLTLHEQRKETLKSRKKRIAFPMRKFAVLS